MTLEDDPRIDEINEDILSHSMRIEDLELQIEDCQREIGHLEHEKEQIEEENSYS